jgi:hypothetical protein
MSTPLTRRFSLTAIAAGLTVPALASAAPEPDAELLDLVKTLDERWAHTEVIAPEMHEISRLYPGVTIHSHAAEARMDAAVDAWLAVQDKIHDISAITPLGVRAKAYALQSFLRYIVMGGTAQTIDEQLDEAQPETAMTWSLVRDIIAQGDVA